MVIAILKIILVTAPCTDPVPAPATVQNYSKVTRTSCYMITLHIFTLSALLGVLLLYFAIVNILAATTRLFQPKIKVHS